MDHFLANKCHSGAGDCYPLTSNSLSQPDLVKEESIISHSPSPPPSQTDSFQVGQCQDQEQMMEEMHTLSHQCEAVRLSCVYHPLCLSRPWPCQL